MPSPRILVLFNQPVLPADHPDAASEHDIVGVADVIRAILQKAGFAVTCLSLSYSATALLSELESRRPDAVFNLFEGLGNAGHTEACIASVLEWQGIAFTGSPAQALHLARNKPLTKTLLVGASLPTPEFYVVDRLPLPRRPWHFPVIVKPALQDASVGIDQASVVRRTDRLTERIAYLLEQYGPPVLVERYIPGREFTISILDREEGQQVLPLKEIRFDRTDPTAWPIMTFDAKWRPETRDYQATPPHFPQDLAPAFAEQLKELAVRAYRLVGCRDYASVDFRVSPAGKPYVIEINPNPCTNPDAGLAAAIIASGETYGQFIVQLARAALARGERLWTALPRASMSPSPPAAKSRAVIQLVP